jgi:hypothetical protein
MIVVTRCFRYRAVSSFLKLLNFGETSAACWKRGCPNRAFPRRRIETNATTSAIHCGPGVWSLPPGLTRRIPTMLRTRSMSSRASKVIDNGAPY